MYFENMDNKVSMSDKGHCVVTWSDRPGQYIS